MPYTLNTAVEVGVSIFGVTYSKFKIYPVARNSDDSLEIIDWKVKNSEGTKVGLYDALITNPISSRLFKQVLIFTFERADVPFVDVKFTVDDESWQFPMRAVEHDDETVHFEVEIEGEWMDTLSCYIGDIFTPDHFPYAEAVVLSELAFGERDEVFASMG